MARKISDSKVPGRPVWNIGGLFITKHRSQPSLQMSVPIQQSLFEDDFLIRTLGEIAYRPETAISELVANAWDAGATCVKVEIPDAIGGTISVSDNGVGLNQDLFLTRWMKLGYKRSQHQGEWAEFPTKLESRRRKAYGRNGQGRHALLCFGEEYHVETLRDGEEKAFRFTVRPSSNESPFVLTETIETGRETHGTRVWTQVTRRLPSDAQISEAISLAFLSDPTFSIEVNERRISFESFDVAHEEPITIPSGTCKVKFLRLPETAKGRTGVAFWVGNRLVGQPSYQILGTPLLDGRSTAARNHFVIVQSDDLFNHVKPDWSGFMRTDSFLEVADEIASHVGKVAAKLNASAIDDTKKAAYIENRDGIRSLTPLGKTELKEFVDGFVERVPGINADILAAGVAAAVNLEQSRSGKALLLQLASIPESEAEQLSTLLQDWTVKDALSVLDEIGRRSATVEAIKKLKGDKSAEELKTMHPLVAQCRWLFGPEFESPSYLSNTTIRSAAEQVFKKQIDVTQIANPRQRPDLVFAKQSTYGITGIDDIDTDSGISRLSKLLLIELKRGDALIVLKHVHQAQQYIQDLLNCGLLDGAPHITAFVVGHRVDPKLDRVTRIGDPEVARIYPISFDQLVRTAESRLFGLSKTLDSHFKSTDATVLLDRLLGNTATPLFADLPELDNQTSKRRKRKKTSQKKK